MAGSAGHRSLLVAVTASAVAGTLPVFLVGALYVQLHADLGIGPTEHGAMVSLFYLAVAVATLPLGVLTDRIGWWRSFALAATMLVVGLVAVAAGARGFAALAVFLVVAGCAHGLAMPAGNLAIVRGVPDGQRGLAFGVRQAAIPLSVLLGGASVPLVAVHVGWRPAFLVAVAVPLTVLVALWVLRRSPAAGPVARTGVRRPPLTRPLVLMLSLCAIGATLVNSSSAFLVGTAVFAGIDEAAAGGLLVLGGAVTFAVRILAGLTVDRGGGRGFGTIAVLLGVGAVGFGLVAVGSPATVVAGTVLAFGAGTGWPGVMHHVVVSEHPAHAGGVSGLILTAGNGAGFLGPVAVGAVTEHVSHAAAWSLLAGLACVAILLVLTAGRGFRIRAATVPARKEPV